MRKAVITGATGFLGLALLKELIQNDIHVYALCRKNSNRISRLDNIPNVTLIEADLNCLDNIGSLDDCDVFYHLAWEGGRNDFHSQYKNVEATVNCLKFASRFNCKRFICTGSQAEYGNTSELINEETPLNPTTAYGACKVAAYYLTSDLAKRLGIEHIWARVFSVYGPHDNPNSLIPCLVDSLLSKGEAALQTDGGHIWNYLYEEDAARALRALGQCGKPNEIYNVASQESKPLKEFVEIIRKSVNPDSTVYYGTEKSEINLNVSVDKTLLNIGDFEGIDFTNGIKKLKAVRLSQS